MRLVRTRTIVTPNHNTGEARSCSDGPCAPGLGVGPLAAGGG